jgi:N-acetylglucosamine-6-phosphate deacetylase
MGDSVLRGGTVDVLISDGRIAALGDAVANDPRADVRVLDAGGLRVVPGFVDLQCNGAHGIDLADTPERLWEVGADLVRSGVTAWCPTIVSSPDETIARAMAALTRPPEGYTGARPLGLHLEGPLLNPERRGAHARDALRRPAEVHLASWTRRRGIALVTLAPEIEGGLDAVRGLRKAGVVVAMGHTAATTAQARAAVDTGVSMITHLFNAMSPFAHREPGPAGVALADARVTAGLIADGLHVHPDAVAAAWAAMGPRRVALVTDAVAARGLQPDAPRTPEGVLAGSVLTMDQAVRNLVTFTGCRVDHATAAASTVPARAVRARRKGRLGIGADADLVLLDDDLHVAATIIAGSVVFNRDDSAEHATHS